MLPAQLAFPPRLLRPRPRTLKRIVTVPSTSVSSATARRSPARAFAAVVAGFLASVALSWLLRPLLSRSIFVFMYGAVAIGALYGGALAGIVTAIVGAVVVDVLLVPPYGRFTLRGAEDWTSVLAFVAVSSMLSTMAASLRRSRLEAQQTADALSGQARELSAQQVQLETMAGDLEEANAELESMMADATAARDVAQAGEERMQLLDEVSRVLTSSLDYETTVAAVARLAVPQFADWCSVDIVTDDGIQQLALAHADPERVRWAKELSARYPVDPEAATGAPAVIRSGEPSLVHEVTDDMLVASARDDEHLRILREVGVYSVITVPMVARGQTLGAMTLVSSRPDRLFDRRDESVAMELARRAAMAVDNARLYRAALAANEAKANFLATMSHELRTPLTAIIGYEELLVEGISGQVNDLQQQQLGRIKASAAHLLSLIDEILLYARVEAGRESVRIEPVVAKGVIDDAVAYVSPKAAERSLTIRAENIDPALLLTTDAGKLRQMLLNLLANAVKFTVRGGVTVRAFEQNDWVVFEVQDTGIGIKPDDLRHIFDSFWQVNQNTTRLAGGSGLGLSVTRRLAQLLGGDIAVESAPDVGSTFRITLPRVAPAVIHAPPGASGR
jgi:signal transduction histidine kinase